MNAPLPDQTPEKLSVPTRIDEDSSGESSGDGIGAALMILGIAAMMVLWVSSR